MARLETREWDEAVSDFSQALKLDPENALALARRGSAKSAKRDWDGALADFDKAIELKPDYRAYNGRSLVRVHKGDPVRALEDINKSIALDSRSAVSFRLRGSIYRMNGDDDRALADYNRALKLDQKFGLAWRARGFLNYDRRDYTNALSDFRMAIQIRGGQ